MDRKAINRQADRKMPTISLQATIHLHPDALKALDTATGGDQLRLEFELSCAAIKHATDLRYKQIMDGVAVTHESVSAAHSATQQLSRDWFAPVKRMFNPDAEV